MSSDNTQPIGTVTPSGEANATYVDIASADPVLPTPVVVPRFAEVDADGRRVDHAPLADPLPTANTTPYTGNNAGRL